jgi:glycosyltransferase involved in cell wall biosynthesis
MKINLIFLCANFTKGGAGNSIIRLCKELKKKKYEISIICLNKFSYLSEIKNTNIKIFKIKKNKIIFSIFIIKNILFKIINKKYKNILISNINYTNVISVLFFRKINILKIILVERTPLKELDLYNSFVDFFKKNIIKFLIKNFYKNSDKIICNSKYMSNDFFRRYRIKSDTINPPSLLNYNNSTKNKNYNKKQTLVMITICRLSFEKNLKILIKSLGNLKFTNFKLIICGSGNDMNKLKILSKKIGLEKKIKFTGYTEKVNYYLKQSHLYINSSLFEGFPNSVVEAINYNLPIISSQSFGGINDILPNKNYGTIINNFNANNLSRAIELFYNNPKIFYKKSEIAKKNIINFSLENNVKNYDNLFTKI